MYNDAMAFGNRNFHWTVCAIWLALVALGNAVSAKSAERARQLYRTGQYEDCIALASGEVESDYWNEDWYHLLAESQITLRR